MAIKIFSKRHPEESDIELPANTRRRLYQAVLDFEPMNSYGIPDDDFPGLSKLVCDEYGWEKLSEALHSSAMTAGRNGVEKQFFTSGRAQYVLSALELYSQAICRSVEFQRKVNKVFDDDGLPWRLVDDVVLKIDSQWLEVEVHAKASELLKRCKFPGPLDEFRQARADLGSGDTKDAIVKSHRALESTFKAVLRLPKANPEALRHDFSTQYQPPEIVVSALEKLTKYRNHEPGVGHGQGQEVNEPPLQTAKFIVNLTGVVVLYAIERYLERHPVEEPRAKPSPVADDDIPF